MSLDHYVIIGNGPAGNHAAFKLRDYDKNARITIISDECLAFYSKPKLTGYVADKISESELFIPVEPSYEDRYIRVRLGQTVERIDIDNKVLFLDHLETIYYTKLIIAVGSRARVLPLMQDYAEHLKLVGSYTDVKEYKNQINAAKDFFIFGGDLVGFRFIRQLRAMNKNVTVLIYPHAFWPYNLTDEMLESIKNSLEKQQVKVVVKDDIAGIEKNNQKYQIRTTQGGEYTADMVFSCNGLTPNIDFIKGSGIDYDQGILVDEYLKTNVDDIYACGSCAQIYNPGIKNYSVSIGWPNAVTQGELVAANLVGEHKGVESAGRKYFDIEGVKIKTTWWEGVAE